MIGWLSSRDAATDELVLPAFRRALAAQGYVEGRNVTVEYRFAMGQLDRLQAFAAEFARSRVSLAAGQGDVGFAVAASLGESGKLIASDFSAAMLEIARRRGEELGLTNVEFRELDAEDLGLEEHCVDGVVCRWGYMLMPNPAIAPQSTV